MRCESQEMMGNNHDRKTKVKSITKLQDIQQKQNREKRQKLLFWRALQESHRNFGHCSPNISHKKGRWGGKDASHIAPYMGTNDNNNKDDDKRQPLSVGISFCTLLYYYFLVFLDPVL